MVKITVDSIECEVGSEQSAQLITRALQSRDQRIDAAEKATVQVRTDSEKAAAQAKTEAEQMRVRATVAESKVTELEKARKDAVDTLPAMVTARVALLEDARSVLGEGAKFDGLTDRKIRETVVGKLQPDIKLDGEPDSFVDGVYRALIAKQAKVESRRGLAAGRAAIGPVPGHQDAEEHVDAEEVRLKNQKATEKAWEKPTVGARAS